MITYNVSYSGKRYSQTQICRKKDCVNYARDGPKIVHSKHIRRNEL